MFFGVHESGVTKTVIAGKIIQVKKDRKEIVFKDMNDKYTYSATYKGDFKLNNERVYIFSFVENTQSGYKNYLLVENEGI